MALLQLKQKLKLNRNQRTTSIHRRSAVIRVLIACMMLSTATVNLTAQETPTWTDANLAAKEHPGFQYLGEYVRAKQAIHVVPCGNRFYVSTYDGGLPGAGWDGKEIAHEWVDAESIKDRLEGFEKVDRSSGLEFTKPPKNAIVLFDGSDKENWAYGKIKNGLLQAGAKTKRSDFKDFTLHLEYQTPFKPELPLSHPDRGNSGVLQLAHMKFKSLILSAWTPRRRHGRLRNNSKSQTHGAGPSTEFALPMSTCACPL